MKKFDLLIDFDGCVTEGGCYPRVAPPRVDAIRVINTWYRQGHTILFASCREGKYQEDAEATLALYGIPYHYFNQNKPERIEKYGHDSRKIGCDFLIDDREMGGMISWNSAYRWVLRQALDKPLVVCVVGESGSGKSLLANYYRKYGFKLIESYTTRPRRSAVEGGHTFITEEEFGAFKKEDMIAYTKFGEFQYCCLKKDIDTLNIYVIDEFGLKYFKEHFSDVYDIVSIRITRAENARIESVGQERVSRDKGKFTMDILEFDYVIDNPNNSKESVFEQADAIMKSIL